jgi:hypothetical protein
MSLQNVTLLLPIVCSPASRKPIVLTPFLEVTVLQNWSGMTFSILALLEANPTLYLDRIQLQLKTVRHMDVSLPTICRSLYRQGWLRTDKRRGRRVCSGAMLTL